MPAYITLFNFTEKGLQGVKDTVTRFKAADQAAKAAGGRIIGVWWLLGQYDGMLIFEAPDDAAATAQLLASGMQGFVRTTTMRAFSEDEMQAIVGGLP
jgi:uncharacterized protein with GYD domain